MATSFITGGAGFIGSRLARRLARRGETVVVFDNLNPQIHSRRPVMPDWPETVRFQKGDVRDADALSAALEAAKPRTVYHLAAETGTGQSYDEPARYCDVNVGGTCNLIEGLRKTGLDGARIVLAGSRAVYGEGGARNEDGRMVCAPPRRVSDLAAGEFMPKDEAGKALTPCPTPESLDPRPASVYASSKLMQEFILTQCSAGTSFQVVILRFQNVYGPGQSLFNSYTGVLSIFARQILDGKELDIYEDGEITRDFVYVDDVVAALEAAGAADAPPDGPVNIGAGSDATILDAAKILLRALGVPEGGYRITGHFRPGDVRYAVADTMLAKTGLGWRPKVSLEAGLGALAEWAKGERAAGRI